MRNKSFGRFLNQKRLEREITLRKMAAVLGISAPFLSDIEHGFRYPPDIEKLRKISDYLTLSREEEDEMMDLAGDGRENVPPDIVEYYQCHKYLSSYIRKTIELEADEKDWVCFERYLRGKRDRMKGPSREVRGICPSCHTQQSFHMAPWDAQFAVSAEVCRSCGTRLEVFFDGRRTQIAKMAQQA